MAANKNNVTKRVDVSRPLTYVEGDTNFQELKNVIDDQQTFESQQNTLNSTYESDISGLRADVDADAQDLLDHENASDPHPQYATDTRVDGIETGIDGLNDELVQPVATFNNIADMKAATTLTVGRKVRTLGYYEPGDGGGNDYEIVASATGTDDGGSFINLAGSGLQARGLFGGAVSVKQFGAAGDGIADDEPRIRAAIEYLPEGSSLFFNPGHYQTTYGDKNDINDWILVENNGCRLWAEPGTVTLENFLMAAAGSFGSPIDIGTTDVNAGDEEITFASAHGLSVGDDFIMLSQINCYSTDAGNFQLGSRNPTTNNLTERPFSEIHTVSEVIDSTTVRIYGTVFYDGYRDNTTGLNDPMTDVTSAKIMKMNSVTGTTFSGLTFQNLTTSNFRELYIYGAKNTIFDRCGFISDSEPGRHVRSIASLGIRFNSCWDVRNPVGSSGSAWNSFIIGGGSQDVSFFDCRIQGGQQSIDFTSGIDDGDPFYESEFIQGMSSQVLAVENCEFDDCSDAATTHPGTYLAKFNNNTVQNCNTGFRGRSRNMEVLANKMRVASTGVAISAFYEDTLIESNNITEVVVQRFGTTGEQWIGISITPMSSEVMNSNKIKNVNILNNAIRSQQQITNHKGVQLRHVGNGVPPDGSFTEFTDGVKIGQSQYHIKGNVFEGCNVECHRYISGVDVIGNNFDCCASHNYWVFFGDDSVRNRVGLNHFDGIRPTTSIVLKGPSGTLTFNYQTQSRVSTNIYSLSNPNNDLSNWQAFNED